MSNENPSVPYGFCQCGCGRKTNPADRTRPRLGHVKGQPMRYLCGHATRKAVHYLIENRGYDTPCWIWQLSKSVEGYGHMSDGTGVQRPAHRVMWERTNGPIPVGLQIDHLCRQPSCVNPEHLEPVTGAVNSQRGRTAKLDWNKVRAIRSALAAGATRKSQADRYGVCIATISHISSGRNWRE